MSSEKPKVFRSFAEFQAHFFPEEYHKRQKSIQKIKNCSNCSRPNGGLCWDVPGENYGHATEINDKFSCINWDSKKV